MFTYTGKMRSRYVTSASTITLETLAGEPVTMPSPVVVSNGYITITVTSIGRYRVRVLTPNSHYSYQIEVSNSSPQVAPSLTPKTVVVATGNESRPVGSDIVMWIGGTTQPVNMQNNDIWFKAGSGNSDTSSPSAPTALVSSAVSSTGFTLSWTPSSDNVGVTGYDVLLDSTVVASTGGTTASLSGLTPDTLYSATVIAKDAAGNLSEPSIPLSVTTAVLSGTLRHSIWAPEPYPYTMAKETGEPVMVSNSFYSYGTSPDMSTWRIIGARLWIPAGQTMTGSVTFSAWFGMDTLISSAPLVTKTVTSVTEGWNEVIFDSVLETNAGDVVHIGYRSHDGHVFAVDPVLPGTTFVTALDGSHIVLASEVEKRGQYKYDSGQPQYTQFIHGIDVIYDEGA